MLLVRRRPNRICKCFAAIPERHSKNRCIPNGSSSSIPSTRPPEEKKVLILRLLGNGWPGGVGKGVMGIKLDDGDRVIGGALVTDGRVNDRNRIVIETESGKTQEYTPKGTMAVGRGGKGEKPGLRTNFSRVIPQPIELVNWDEVEGKTPKSGKSD